MASSYVFQNFASRMSRSSLLGACASPSSRAAALFTPRASEGGIGACSNLFRGATLPGTAVPGNHGIQKYATRYATVPCSHADAKTSWPINGMPSVVINSVKPSFAGCVRGTRTMSSGAPHKHGASSEAKKAAQNNDIGEYFASLNRSAKSIAWGCAFFGLVWMYTPDSSSGGRKNSKGSQSKS